jgi:hypothetical protein
LVSQHFIDSDFIYEKELPTLIGAAEAGDIKLFWLPISHCTWELTPLVKYQAAGKIDPKHPLSEMTESERDAAYKVLFQEIKDAFDERDVQ